MLLLGTSNRFEERLLKQKGAQFCTVWRYSFRDALKMSRQKI